MAARLCATRETVDSSRFFAFCSPARDACLLLLAQSGPKGESSKRHRQVVDLVWWL